MNIDILVDNPQSWFVSFALKLNKSLDLHNSRLIHDVEECTKGTVLFILSCEKIIKKNVRDLYDYAIVIHASDLPKGKGWSPLSWQILEGKKTITLSMILAEDSVDAGDILMKDALVYNGSELLDELREKMGAKILEMCSKFIANPIAYKAIKQTGESTFYKKRGKESSEIDPQLSIEKQFPLLQIVDNERYPAFFYLNGSKYILKIYKVENSI